MKKLLFPCFLIILFIIFNNIKAQTELWGMTSEGGYSKGVIFKTDSSGSNYNIQHYFENREKNPKGTLIKASNGKYYGMSDNGGNHDLGCIFEYDSSDDSVFILHHFDGTATGSHPKGDLLEASNGKFYGMTRNGGIADIGVVFEFDVSDTTITKIYDGNHGLNARLPYGNLIEATNGNLYGMMQQGGTLGAGGDGCIFKIDLSGPTLTILYTFTGGTIDGLHPIGNLLQVNDSLLYGVTPEGGTGGQGTVFKFNIDIDKHTKLYDFDGISGSGPRGSPVEATNGNLYGVFNSGSGVSYNGGIFEYDIDDSTLSVSYDFGWVTHNPKTGGILGNLVEGESNMLFGMTNRGGANDDGALFKYNCSSGTFTKLYDFSFSINDNENVYGSLIESSSGNFLGLTNQGGTTSNGTIFEYDTTTTAMTIKHSLNSYSHGENPNGSMLAASNGKFYGLTVAGGKYNAGDLFEYDPIKGIYIKWHDFDGVATGAGPYGSLIEASNGKLYGMTKWGGTRWGVLFEFDPGTGVLSKLHDFVDATGTRPIGSLLQASNGKLYGMTSYGGTGNYGLIFEYDITTDAYASLFNFTHTTTGKNPEGSLIETVPGILYGMARFGGSNGQGTIFKYEIASSTLTVEHDFSNNTDGREPRGDLIMASNGKLYGLARDGGTSGHGTVFEYDTTAGGTFTTVHSFQGSTTGRYPLGSLVESSDGHLYGMCSEAAYPYEGTLFRVDTSTNSVTKIQDFNNTNGSKPQYTQLVKIVVRADWTGAVGTDWHNPANWLQNAVPDPFTEVVIPDVSAASGNFPVVSSNTKVRKLTIDNNATLNVQTGIVFQVGNN